MAVRNPRHAARRLRQGGAAAIEFIVVFPIMILLLTGLTSYGLVFWAHQGLGSMSAELAGQIVRLEWHAEGTVDLGEVALALQQLQEHTSGPAGQATLCAGSPAISAGDEEEPGILSVCLEVTEGVLTLPLLPESRVTTYLKVPQQ